MDANYGTVGERTGGVETIGGRAPSGARRDGLET